MRKLALLLIFPSFLTAQSVVELLNAKEFAITQSTVVLTVTASQGDGTTCTFTKLNGAKIGLSASCVSADGKTQISGGILRSASAAIKDLTLALGDVLCAIAANPTSAAVSMGSLGSVPAGGIGWSCSTNIRTNGTVTGQTAPTSGSVTWP